LLDSPLPKHQGEIVEVTFQIPDELAGSVADVGDLPRRALEAFALEELRAGRITEPHHCEMLGLARIQMDGFLKSHGIFHDYTMADFERERAALKRLGLMNRCASSSLTPDRSIT
jgi:hypothetical protein